MSVLLKRIGQYVIISVILLTPLILVNEINVGLGGSYAIKDYNIRAIKEYFMIIIIGLSILYSFANQKFNWTYKFLPIMLLVMVILLLNNTKVPFNILVCGFRWLLPFLLPIFLYDFVEEKFLKKCYQALFFIFVIHVSMQVVELFIMPHYNGTTYFGLTARVPGIFNRSHASAYFSCLFYLLLVKFAKSNSLVIGTILVVFSLILASSSTGVIVFLVIFLINKYKKVINVREIIILLPVIVVLTFLNADEITNRREGSSVSSISTRLRRFDVIFENSTLLSETFGYATNGAFTLHRTKGVMIKKDYFADSFYNSLFGNLGILLTFAYFVLLCILFFYVVNHNLVYPLLFLLFYSMFSVSNIFTEVYPGNLFFSIMIAFFLKEYERNRVLNLIRHHYGL